MPKPSACVFIHGVGMTLMCLVGVSSQHRPWWGPTPFHAMVEAKTKNVFAQEAAFFLVRFYVE
jgi:hypothetical protein